MRGCLPGQTFCSWKACGSGLIQLLLDRTNRVTIKNWEGQTPSRTRTDSASLLRSISIELNGATSEATSIYDEKTSIWQAYRTLYRQWELVYRIGAMNRDGGAAGISPWPVLKEWLSYQRTSTAYPAAD